MLFLEGESNHPSVLLHLQQEGGRKKNSSVAFLCGRSPRVGTYLSSYPEREKGKRREGKQGSKNLFCSLDFKSPRIRVQLSCESVGTLSSLSTNQSISPLPRRLSALHLLKRTDFNAFRKSFPGPNLTEAASLSGLPLLLWNLIAHSGLGLSCDSAVPNCHQALVLLRAMF